MGMLPKVFFTILMIAVAGATAGCDTRGCCGDSNKSASAGTTGGGGGTSGGGGAGAPAPALPAPGGTVTMSDSTGVVTVTGMNRGVIHGPYLAGQDQYTIWDGLRKGPSEKGASRPFVAGGYSGSPGWGIGAIVPSALLGTYTGDSNVGSTAVRLPTSNDDGSGGNTAFAVYDGVNWLLGGWQDAAPANSNFGLYYGPKYSYSWKDNSLIKIQR